MGVAILATLTSLKTKQKYFLSLQKELFIQAKATEGFFLFIFLGLAKNQQLKYCGFISHEGRIHGKTCYILFSVAFEGRVLLGEEEISLFLQSRMSVLSEMEGFSVPLLLLSSGGSKSPRSIFHKTKKDTQATFPHHTRALLWHA